MGGEIRLSREQVIILASIIKDACHLYAVQNSYEFSLFVESEAKKNEDVNFTVKARSRRKSKIRRFRDGKK